MVVVFFIVKSESKRSPGTDFAVEDMKENIPAIFVYIAANFLISNRIESNRKKTFEISNTNRISFLSLVCIIRNGESVSDTQ